MAFLEPFPRAPFGAPIVIAEWIAALSMRDFA